MRARRLLAAMVALLVVVAGAVVVVKLVTRATASDPACYVGGRSNGYFLQPEQAANAATIAAVGKQERLPNHAVTVALATALQESKLRNVPNGDLDSVGLFQQRPSQGWGSPQQLIQPAYAARAFYQHLEKVPGWQTADIATAAQAVQHSADGSAYAKWEDQARAMARALTGEVAAGLTCQFDPKHVTPAPAQLTAAARTDLGTGGLSRASWASASWLVAHAYGSGVTRVSVLGRVWTATSGEWVADARAGQGLSYRLAAARS